MERNLIVERTQAGLVEARARGRVGGRPAALSEAQIDALNTLYKSGDLSVKQLCEQFFVSRATLYKYLRK